MSILSAVQRLNRVNWNFPNSGTAPGSVHTLHWFPGNFIPQIPAALIQILSSANSLVLDPFAGSGTTGIEAARLGRRALMSDRMSVCSLIMRAKLAYLSGAFDRPARSAVSAQLTFAHQCRSDRFGTRGEGSSAELDAWFAPDTLAQLRFLWGLVEAQDETASRHVLTAIFSDVLFDCAAPGAAQTSTGKRRRHHWGWVADNVHPRELVAHNAIAVFQQRLTRLDEPGPEVWTGIASAVQQDVRSLALPTDTVDLIVTSPPYNGMIDYTHANRLLYLWMNWSTAAERREEIGARFRRKRLHAVGEYLTEMHRARDELHRVLRPGGFCALVVGESRRFPGTAQKVFAEFAKVMPIIWGPTPRLATRRRVSDRAAREPVEFICVFHKLS